MSRLRDNHALPQQVQPSAPIILSPDRRTVLDVALFAEKEFGTKLDHLASASLFYLEANLPTSLKKYFQSKNKLLGLRADERYEVIRPGQTTTTTNRGAGGSSSGPSSTTTTPPASQEHDVSFTKMAEKLFVTRWISNQTYRPNHKSLSNDLKRFMDDQLGSGRGGAGRKAALTLRPVPQTFRLYIAKYAWFSLVGYHTGLLVECDETKQLRA